MTYGLDGTPRREISLPGPGTAAGFDGHPEDRETFYSFTDLITPPTIYRYDLESGAGTLVHAPQVAFDPASFEQRQVFYPARTARASRCCWPTARAQIAGRQPAAAVWIWRLRAVNPATV